MKRGPKIASCGMPEKVEKKKKKKKMTYILNFVFLKKYQTKLTNI